MALNVAKFLCAVAVAASAAPLGEITLVPSRRAGESGVYLVSVDQLCLSGSGNLLEWSKCEVKPLVFQTPKAPLSSTKLRTLDGKQCLTAYPLSDNTPSVKLAKCGADADVNQLWGFKFGPQKNKLRSHTTLKRCTLPGGGVAPCAPDAPNPGPMCIGNDDGYAWLAPCDYIRMGAATKPAAPVVPALSPVQQFNAALKTVALEQVDATMVGKVMNGHNDRTFSFITGTTVAKMIKTCNEYCIEFDCDNFEVVLGKNICNLSLSGGSTAELKADPNAAVFFRDA